MSANTSYDIAVLGGGPAGVAAAVTAARSGASVVLIDRANRIGGSVTAALHRCLCGLYSDEPRSPADTLNEGVQREVVERLLRKAPADVRTKSFGKAWVLEFPSAAYTAVLADLCRDAKVDIRLGTVVERVSVEKDRIRAIETTPATDAQACLAFGSDVLAAKAFVDCSGTGVLLSLANSALPLDDVSMLAGYSIRLSGIEGDPDLLRLGVPYFLTQAVDAGRLDPLARYTVFHPGPGPDEGVIKLAIDVARLTATDVTSFARQVMADLKVNIEALANTTITETSPHAMVRGGRRLSGRYVVTEGDVLKPGPPNAYSQALGWWPIEWWSPDSGPTYQFADHGVPYYVPESALESDRIDNLFAAGMCTSSTHGAAASIRASGICLATGDLAGRLAARNVGF